MLMHFGLPLLAFDSVLHKFYSMISNKKLPPKIKYLFLTPYASVSDSNFSKIIRFLTIDNFGNR